MLIAITSEGAELSSSVDARFGRARYFIVYDTESGQYSVADNASGQNAMQGAGVQTGKTISDLGVQAVVTGHVGPKAFATLQAGGISVYTGATGTVAEAVEQFKSNRLVIASGADRSGHW